MCLTLTLLPPPAPPGVHTYLGVKSKSEDEVVLADSSLLNVRPALMG